MRTASHAPRALGHGLPQVGRPGRRAQSTMSSASYRAQAKLWQRLCTDAALNDLPYKIETTASGTITMSPASNRHGDQQVEIALRLRQLLRQGAVQVEASIATQSGIKVADVVWKSPQFVRKHGTTTPFAAAPEICVEVVSPSNHPAEISAKIAGYLAAGAHEVWICTAAGALTFHAATGPLKHSRLCPRFPSRIP